LRPTVELPLRAAPPSASTLPTHDATTGTVPAPGAGQELVLSRRTAARTGATDEGKGAETTGPPTAPDAGSPVLASRSDTVPVDHPHLGTKTEDVATDDGRSVEVP